MSAALALGVATIAPVAIANPDHDDAVSGKSRGKRANDLYIVRMADSPVVAYEGGIPGLQATKPRKGTKINPNDSKVVRYASYLDARHDDAVARVGGRKEYSYRYSFNGFAAGLTPAQAEALKSAPGVLSVEKDQLYEMDTSTTPAFLGLTQPAPVGLWSRARGENVIIGIVDSGVWPGHGSFSDRTGVNGNATRDGKLGYQQIPGWHGKCTPGEAFTGTDCNQKLIGARYYNAGWGGSAEVKALFPFEFISPRDWGGHGTHTSSTAGGNASVPATGLAAALGSINGIAPRARIATYKVCWADTPTGGGCFGSDSVAAIDQAVADGVDVINFSISGTRTNFRDAVEIAFMFAADAGVFVAASAGNSGPTTFTVAHPGPWLTTVAAGTHNRNGTGAVTLGNGVTYTGASFANAVGPKSLIDAASAGLAGADAVKVQLCYSAADNAGVAVLDPAKVAGKIVLCKRGATALVNKTGAVAAAGGAGVVLYNDPVGGTNLLALVHAVPTVHIVATSGLAIKAYIASDPAAATASIAQSTIVTTAAAPFTASFSSRGPLLAGNGDLLKPDLIAPGQDILAAVAPPNNGGNLFALYSGTSMSSPHVAGLAALFKELHPDWSPMAIKSALMTTAGDVLDGPNTNPIVIFRQGAGHVQPNVAANPGLVFDSGFADWMAFICGTQPGSFCLPGQGIDPSNFNVASIAIGDMAGVQEVTRRVTNVSGSSQTFTASVTGMTGFTVTLPAPMTFLPGETKAFSVKFLRTTAALNAYTGGQLRLTSASHTVRVPMVVAPVAMAAPVSVFSNGSPVSYNVTFGFSGPFTAAARGLVPAALTSGTVADDSTNGSCSLSTPNAQLIDVVIPAGTTHARFSLFDADVSAGADIDLCVFRGTTLQGSSGSGTSAEEVNLVNPVAGTYKVVVHGWGVAGSSPFKLHTWLVDSAAAGNMTVSFPATATIGTTGAIGLTFSGLTSGTKYMGSVAYTGSSGLPVTLVRVDP
ncbi:MAG: S8 family serine peptidase [Pseudomonadota bacterium]|nr:S8 family serine peptidase [Pseudomonadota bacterium]